LDSNTIYNVILQNSAAACRKKIAKNEKEKPTLITATFAQPLNCDFQRRVAKHQGTTP
jgi:hypothetical protein